MRTEPLDAYTFNLWWLDQNRYYLLQSKEGREQIRLGVQGQQLANYDAGHEADPSVPPVMVADGARLDADIWTNPQKLLAILPADDPRAIFLRAGGRMDAGGNPLKEDGTPYTDHEPLPAWYLNAQAEMARAQHYDPLRPAAGQASAPAAPSAPEPAHPPTSGLPATRNPWEAGGAFPRLPDGL